ncbi:DUF2868 domain-containing protein [Hahella ganghwensis]|uniref:DUF2868 domain-containing protein n=1 Tax=Hahella ganghwensis TaxID=286420 RepID=UPI00036092AA|nr:DUF2868 domain-containing protein [Hahella ganghwensis]
MNKKFKQQLYSEVLHKLESDQSLSGSEAIEVNLAKQECSILEKVLLRAQRLAKEHDLEPVVQKILSRFRLTSGGVALLFFILGSGASMQAFQQSQVGVVNFYWLITVLLGFNLIALLLWIMSMIGATFSGTGISGPGLWIQKLVTRYLPGNYIIKSAAQGVFSTLLSGAIGRWWLSRMTHSFWLSYLTGGFVTILLMLSTRQFNFVWETTILSTETFSFLTQWLSVVPSWAGFEVPTAEQIVISQLDKFDPANGESLRQVWASLLIGSMMVYGLLPRALLLLLSHTMVRRGQNRYKLDLASPYYVNLRQRLMPATSQFGVVDPDLRKKPEKGQVTSAWTDIRLPAEALYVGIELNQDQPWPPTGIPHRDDLGKVEDRASQQALIQRLASSGKKPVVAVIPLNRSPDRGLERLLGAIRQNAKGDLYIALSEAGSPQDAHDGLTATSSSISRQSDWYQLAVKVGIGAEAIARMQYQPQKPGAERKGNLVAGNGT